MSFKDIYEKYINGNATEEEERYIEEELEKNELINDILGEKLDQDILDLVTEKDDSSKEKLKDDSILKEINKAVRKKLIITGFCSVLVVILLGLGSKYVVSPLMDLYYYNPTEKVGETSTIFEQDFAFFSELHYPGVVGEFIFDETRGYGNYQVTISLVERFRNTYKLYTGEIDKGKLISMPVDFYQNSLYGSFYSREKQNSNIRNDENELKELRSLQNTEVAKVTVSFKEDVSMEKINELKMQYGNLYFEWVAVRTYPIGGEFKPMLGFRPYSIASKDSIIDDKRYPDIQMDSNYGMEIDSKIFERHFMSLLKYMIDNEKFTSIFKGTGIDRKQYKDAIDYVYANGVKSYGIVVSGKPEDILKLREESVISSIFIDDIAVSTFSK